MRRKKVHIKIVSFYGSCIIRVGEKPNLNDEIEVTADNIINPDSNLVYAMVGESWCVRDQLGNVLTEEYGPIDQFYLVKVNFQDDPEGDNAFSD